MPNTHPTWWELAGGVAAIVLILETVFRGSKSVVLWLFRLLVRLVVRQPRIPRETVRIVPDAHRCLWSDGATVGDKPATQVMADFHATNIARLPVTIVQARIKSPATVATMVTVRHHQGNFDGMYELMPGLVTAGRAVFFIQPPIRKKRGEEFKATVVFVDNLGNEHKKRFAFSNLG